MTKSEKIIRALKKHPGMTSAEISKRLGSAVHGLVFSLMEKEKIVRTGVSGRYRYYVAEKKKAVVPEPSISLSERIALMDAPIFNAVKRRQEAAHAFNQ